MPAPHDTLLLSSARQVDPKDQRQREESLLARARLGEIHLHVSTLHGQLLALGLFHPPLPTARARIWRRHTGGRAVAAGAEPSLVKHSAPSKSSIGVFAAFCTGFARCGSNQSIPDWISSRYRGNDWRTSASLKAITASF